MRDGVVVHPDASDRRPGVLAANPKVAMKRDASLDRLSRSPIHLLHRAGQCAGDIFHAEMKDGDLTPRQLAVLITVAQNEGLSQTGLVDRTGIDRSTLADIVRRLQRKGLLQRRRTKEDARAYAVKLTDEGRRILRTAEPTARRVDERILEALPNKQREQFIDELQSIVDTLQKLSPNT
jgi:MarR family transcriptional regulator, temperature-dependent positive regulator of motility